jgi:hypothetical protein
MIDLLHFENSDNEFVTDVAEDTPVAFSAKLLQPARTTPMIVIKK